MDTETLKKLNKIQCDIESLDKAIEQIKRIGTIKYKISTDIQYDSMLPIDLVPGLENELRGWILDQFMEKRDDLKQRMSDLTVCVKSNEMRYKPTDF